MVKSSERQEAWLLFKKHDEWARDQADYDVTDALPDSVVAHPLPFAEEAIDCQEYCVGALVSSQVVPVLVEVEIEPPSPRPSSEATATILLPSVEQAMACHSLFVSALVSSQAWAKLAGIAARSNPAVIPPAANTFEFM